MEPRSESAERTVALVTGAAQGIGLGIAGALAAASYKIMLADIEDAPLQQSVAGLRAAGFEAVGQHLDVTQSDEWDRAMAAVASQWGGARPSGQLRGHQSARDRGIDRARPSGIGRWPST